MKIHIFLKNIKISKYIIFILLITTITSIHFLPHSLFALDLDIKKSKKIQLTDELNVILNDLKIIREEIDIIKHELLELETKIIIIENQIKNLEDNIKNIEIELEKTIKALHEKAIEFYKRKNNSFFQAVISPKNIINFFKNMNLFEYMMNQESNAINNYIDTKEKYIKNKLILDENNKELKEKNDEYSSTYNLLQKKEEEQERKLEIIKAKIAELDKEIIDIQARIKKVQAQYPNLNIIDEYRVLATGYCPCPICCGKFSSGYTAIGLKAGHGVVAVDPKFISLRTKLLIPGYGISIAGDTGKKIKGPHIDLGFDEHISALRYGVRYIRIYKIEE